MVKVGIIEDNIFLLKSFKDYLDSTEGIKVSFACHSMEEAKRFLNKSMFEEPNIILLDIFLPGENGQDGIKYFKTKFPDSHVIMLTAYNDQSLIMESIRKGASGYALKTAQLSNLTQIIKQVRKSGAYLDEMVVEKIVNNIQISDKNEITDTLTIREKEIVDLVKKGLSYKQMSDLLFITTFTVNYHLKNIYKKLGIHSKSELLSMLMDKRTLV